MAADDTWRDGAASAHAQSAPAVATAGHDGGPVPSGRPAGWGPGTHMRPGQVYEYLCGIGMCILYTYILNVAQTAEHSTHLKD